MKASVFGVNVHDFSLMICDTWIICCTSMTTGTATCIPSLSAHDFFLCFLHELFVCTVEMKGLFQSSETVRKQKNSFSGAHTLEQSERHLFPFGRLTLSPSHPSCVLLIYENIRRENELGGDMERA